MKNSLKCLFMLSLALGLAPSGRAAAKPNIILFLADDLGYADIGANGCADIPTPNIDSIARNGVRFTDGHSTHPVCSPSRAGLMSGLYQQRFGFEHNSGPERYAADNFGLPRTVPTLAEKLKAAGYATGMVGKWHIGFKEGLRPHERGFDFHYGFLGGARTYLPGKADSDPLVRNGVQEADEKEYLTDAFAREAVKFIGGVKGQPYFLYCAFNAVHAPLDENEYMKRFPNLTGKRRTYAGMLSGLDDAVGRVLAKVRSLGQEDDTLIFFYSDNGGPTMETTSRNDPLRGYKGQVFEGGVRVPFLMQWKARLPAGKECADMVMGFDCHATALVAAGLPLPADQPLDGVNLVPFLTGEQKGPPHDRLFWRSGDKYAARVGEWKLVREREGGEQLFNLKDDLGEKADLAATNPEKLKELQAAYKAWSAQMMPAQWLRQDARTQGGARRAKGAGRAGGRLDGAVKDADKNGDGKLTRAEIPRLFESLDTNKDGAFTREEAQAFTARGAPEKPAASAGGAKKAASSGRRRSEVPWARYAEVTPTPHTEEIAEQRPGEPPLKKMPDGDPARDAAGRGQLFESIVVPGFTSLQEGMNGVAIVDLNRDGLLDIVATYSAPRGTGGRWGSGEKLRVFINEGGFKFRQHTIKLLDAQVTPESFGRGQVPNFADFNNDGFLDLFVTRHAQMTGGQTNPADQKIGNGLYLSEGAWDIFRDVSSKMGIQNEKAYNRQPSIADVNKDGRLDIAVGCDNIKDAMGGFPHSRLYIAKAEGRRMKDEKKDPPAGASSADLHPSALILQPFEDIGGTDLVPDFGGFYHDSAKDKAGPDINLRDLDNDGDLDLIQSYHCDVMDLAATYSPVDYRQGVFCWKNLLAETGKFQFEKITGNGLACEARLILSADKKMTEPVGKAPGLPYISLADVDNDGLLDVLAVGPASPGWAPRTEYVSGRFWRNKGGFQFQEATAAAGLGALNGVYRDWLKFFDAPQPPARAGARIDPLERRPYFADVIFGDFNNDGWVDVVVQDRHESQSLEARAILFMNRGDGTFELKPTTFSGLDAHGICGEAADLNNDGLLDLLFAADPDNSGVVMRMDRYESKVYWNTGLHGARENHWLRLRFSGVTDAELIGARVDVSSPGMQQHRWIHANHSYKSGGALEAHFGLGQQDNADVKVTLPGGTTVAFAGVKADQFLHLNLKTSQSTPVRKKATP